jgi:hypothetical protein
MTERRPKNGNNQWMRDAHRRAELRQLVDDHRAENGVPPPPASRRRVARPSEPAPGARIYRVTIVTPGSENEVVQVEAASLQDAKKHAMATFMSTPAAIGLMVREVRGAEADA